MPTEQTIDKLYSMKLTGMAEGFKEQLQQPSFSQLSFEERFGSLVDRQSWRRGDVVEPFHFCLPGSRLRTASATAEAETLYVAPSPQKLLASHHLSETISFPRTSETFLLPPVRGSSSPIPPVYIVS